MAIAAGGNPIRTSPTRWVAQKFDILYALPQFIEYGSRAFEQRLSVHGWLDTAWAAVEQSRVQCFFEIGNHFRHVWLRYAKLHGGASHAAVLHNREKQVQVPQGQTAANLAV